MYLLCDAMVAERKHIDSATKATKMGYGMEDEDGSGSMINYDKYRMKNFLKIGNRNRPGRNRQ